MESPFLPPVSDSEFTNAGREIRIQVWQRAHGYRGMLGESFAYVRKSVANSLSVLILACRYE